jgi:hypothetical protein
MIVLLVFFCFHSYMYLSPIEFKILYKVSVTRCIQRFSLANICIECLKIREFQIQSVVGDHFSSPNMEIKKIRTPPTKINWFGLKVHSLKCVFFKYRLKSSVFIVIYGVDDCEK